MPPTAVCSLEVEEAYSAMPTVRGNFSRGNSRESGKAKTPEGGQAGGRAERSGAGKGGAGTAVPMSSSGCLIHWRSSRCPIAVLHLFSSPNRLQFLLMSVADGSRDSARTYGQTPRKNARKWSEKKQRSRSHPRNPPCGSHACVLQAMRSRLAIGRDGGGTAAVSIFICKAKSTALKRKRCVCSSDESRERYLQGVRCMFTLE